jgi:hypothetical protein
MTGQSLPGLRMGPPKPLASLHSGLLAAGVPVKCAQKESPSRSARSRGLVTERVPASRYAANMDAAVNEVVLPNFTHGIVSRLTGLHKGKIWNEASSKMVCITVRTGVVIV